MKAHALRVICNNEQIRIKQYTKEGRHELKPDIVTTLVTGDVYDMDWDAFHPDNNYNCVMLLNGNSYVGFRNQNADGPMMIPM